MYGSFRFPGRASRVIVGALLAIVLLFSTVGTLFAAGTTGTISGTITDQKTGQALPDVKVTAVSPTGSYSGTTDQKGFFSFTGVTPDTFTISFELKGFQPASITGVSVFADQAQDVSTKLAKSLSTIGSVISRSPGGAFQPKQTQDTYTVTASQIETIQGRADAISESNLLVSLPGATYDSSGYPVLRGGRENEEGFQFEGIDYTDAFTSQFVNSLALNPSIGSLQLTPGSGDATTGNAGTGTINLISKRGTYPGFGSIQGTIQGPDYDHELGIEFGFATPNGRFSNYFAYQGSREYGANYGHGVPSRLIGRYFTVDDQKGDDIVDNMVFKFGRNNNQSFQIFYQTEIYNFFHNYGADGTLTYKTADPYYLANAEGYSGLSASQIQSLTELLPDQPSPTALLNKSPAAYYQPNATLKFQYSNNLNSSTFLTAKFYRVSSATTFDFPFDGQDVFFAGFNLKQGGNRTGGQIDITKQLGSKNLVQIGGKYDFLSPSYDQVDPGDGFFSALFGGLAYDFVPDTNAACPFGQGGGCGYLFNYLKNPGTIPRNNEQSSTLRQDFSTYVSDTFSPNDKLKIQGGLRLDGSDYRFGSGLSQFYAPAAISADGFPLDSHGNPVSTDTQQYATNITSDETKPLVVEPRLSAAYQLGSRDAVRASYGRSVEFASLGVVDLSQGTGQFSRFSGIPATFASCGVTGNLKCQNYADQLYWANQNFLEGIPYQPVKPATFTNYDFSYSHEFQGGIGLKMTPFYRRGYDGTALVANPRLGTNGLPLTNPDGSVIFGPNTATNLGVERTTGLEFLLTKEAPVGFSGSLSATYINETSNVIPNSGGEDFFPSIPSQSLALGNEYRVGFLSPFQTTLAVQYKSKGGIRINPQIYYERGYPIGQGLITATYINGIPYNVPDTNITNSIGASSAPQYVDPQNPGTIRNPNIAATRGTAETASAGGVIGHGGLFANLTLEWSKPGSRSTFGVQIFNLTNNVYNGFGDGNPYITNTRYQPIATGISGPLSGYSTTAGLYPTLGSTYYYPGYDNGQSAYLQRPSYDTTQYQIYYNLKI
jgi:hypothetical protein